MLSWLPKVSLRRVRLLAVLVLCGTFCLSGCVKVELSAAINHNDTVSGRLTVALDDKAAKGLGPKQSSELIESVIAGFPDAAPQRDYSDGTFVGKTVVFDEVPLSQFRTDETGQPGDAQLSIEHSGKHYRLDAEWALPPISYGGDIAEFDQSKPPAPQIHVAITFPGTVDKHNGALHGQTVSWELKMGTENVLFAKATESSSPGNAVVVLVICLVIMVLVMIALFIQLRRHSIGARRK